MFENLITRWARNQQCLSNGYKTRYPLHNRVHLFMNVVIPRVKQNGLVHPREMTIVLPVNDIIKPSTWESPFWRVSALLLYFLMSELVNNKWRKKLMKLTDKQQDDRNKILRWEMFLRIATCNIIALNWIRSSKLSQGLSMHKSSSISLILNTNSKNFQSWWL